MVNTSHDSVSSYSESGEWCSPPPPHQTSCAERAGEEWSKSIDHQPYRTAPLVSPAPRTYTASQYQQFRGPQYQPTPRQQHRVSLPSIPVIHSYVQYSVLIHSYVEYYQSSFIHMLSIPVLIHSFVQTPPFYLRGSSSMTNLHSSEATKEPNVTVSPQATSSCQASPVFTRQHDSFSNYKPRGHGNKNGGEVREKHLVNCLSNSYLLEPGTQPFHQSKQIIQKSDGKCSWTVSL